MRNPHAAPMIDQNILDTLDASAEQTKKIWGNHIGAYHRLITKSTSGDEVSYISMDDYGAALWQMNYNKYENTVTLVQGTFSDFMTDMLPLVYPNTAH